MKPIIYSLFYCFSEALLVSGNGHLNLLEKIFGEVNNSFYGSLPFIFLGFVIAASFAFRNDIINLFKELLNIFLKIMANISNGRKKKGRKHKILANAYSYYSISLIVLLIGFIPLHIFMLKQTIALQKLSDFSSIGFLISSLFLTIVYFFMEDKNDRKKPNFILMFILGILAGFSVIPGISPVLIIFCGLLLMGTGTKFAYKFSLIINMFILLIRMIIWMVAKKAFITFSISGFIMLILCALVTYGAIYLFYYLCRNKKIFIIDIYIFALGLIFIIF
ncbi:MAG: hypothetical protein K6D02_04675 [Lachnospiraceae bacterium]|nr:hypothetical protein [Lachnospiraceae bacterium]